MSDTTSNPSMGNSRRFWFILLGAIVVICAICYGVYWFLHARYFESTDDAYVGGNIVVVTSRETSTVIGLHADNTQTVKRGQLLVELDSSSVGVALAVAQADYQRRQSAAAGVVSGEELAHARDQVRTAQAALTAAQGGLQQ